jgi:hypothetical protein
VGLVGSGQPIGRDTEAGRRGDGVDDVVVTGGQAVGLERAAVGVDDVAGPIRRPAGQERRDLALEVGPARAGRSVGT